MILKGANVIGRRRQLIWTVFWFALLASQPPQQSFASTDQEVAVEEAGVPERDVYQGLADAQMHLRVPSPQAMLENRVENIGLNISGPEQAKAALEEVPALAQGRRVRIIWVNPFPETSPAIIKYLASIAPPNSEIEIVNYEADAIEEQQAEADRAVDQASVPENVLSEADQHELRAISKRENGRIARHFRSWQKAVQGFGSKIKRSVTTNDQVKLDRYASKLAVTKAGALLAVWLYSKFDVTAGWHVMSVAGLAAVSSAGLQYVFTRYQEGWVQARANARLPVVVSRTDVPWWNPFGWARRIASSSFRAFNISPWLKAMVIDPVMRGGVSVYMRFLAYWADPLNTPPPWSAEFGRSWMTANADIPISSGFDMKWVALYEKGAISRSLRFWGYHGAGIAGYIKTNITDMGFSAHPLGWLTVKIIAATEFAIKIGVIGAEHFLPPLTERARKLTGVVPTRNPDEVQIVFFSGQTSDEDKRTIEVLNGLQGININGRVKQADGTYRAYGNIATLHKIAAATPPLPKHQTKLQTIARTIQRWLAAVLKPADTAIRRGCHWAFSKKNG